MKYYFLVLGTAVFVCVGCAADSPTHLVKNQKNYTAPPAAMLQRPGPMVDGPGPGVMMPQIAQVSYNQPMGGTGASTEAHTSQVRFIGPAGMHVGWKIGGGYAESQMMTPGRYNFGQAATYRLKLTNIPGPGREGLELYPTLQVYPAHPSTHAYLMHNTIPVELTDEDFAQVESNNFVTKVIYLPEAKYQELAIAGVETLVSTRLDPGVDPVSEANRRGTILVVLRVGNKDIGEAEQLQASIGPNGQIQQASFRLLNGMEDQHEAPMPIAVMGQGLNGVPGPQIMGGSGAPGAPAQHMIAGMGPIPSWGMPSVATPIGLPGPAHIPLGGPAGLRTHTMRNHTPVDIGKPVNDLLIDVTHTPGYKMPHPVQHIEYRESHPEHAPSEELRPAWALPGAGAVNVNQ